MFRTVFAAVLVFVSLVTIIHARDPDCVTALDFSDDGFYYATGHCDASVRIWDTETDSLLVAFAAPQYSMTSAEEIRIEDLALSPDGKQLVVSIGSCCVSSIGVMRLLSVATGELITESFFANASGAVDWHPDGSRFAMLGSYGSGPSTTASIFLFNKSGMVIKVFYTGGPSVLALDWSPDGKRIAQANGTTATIWNATTWDVVYKTDYEQVVIGAEAVEDLPDRDAIVTSVAWSFDGNRLATIDSKALYIWDSQTGEQQTKFLIRSGRSISDVAWSLDGRFVASTSEDVIEIWSIESGELAFTVESEYVHDLDRRPDGVLFYVSGKVQSFDLRIAAASQDE